MANQLFQGYVFNDAGAAVVGATVNLYDRGTVTPVRATTTTDATGLWTISHATEGRFDVEIVNGSSVRRRKYDDQMQADTLEVGALNIRNPAKTFDYSILPAAIAADRTLTLPLITATDTLATLGLAQTFTATKTFTGGLSVDGKLRPSTGTPDTQTIVGGVITYAKFYTRVEPQGGVADDLDTISGGAEGDLLLLSGSSGASTVTVKDGTGNIQIDGDCALTAGTNQQHLLLMFVNSAWRELLRKQYA